MRLSRLGAIALITLSILMYSRTAVSQSVCVENGEGSSPGLLDWSQYTSIGVKIHPQAVNFLYHPGAIPTPWTLAELENEVRTVLNYYNNSLPSDLPHLRYIGKA